MLLQLLGAGVGVTFATVAQITKGLRGKVDEVNSFMGGAAVGALTASQVCDTSYCIHVYIFVSFS